MSTFTNIPMTGRNLPPTDSKDEIAVAMGKLVLDRWEPQLRDTVPLMLSNNYKERFIAEYWQLKIRYEKLKEFNNKIEAAGHIDQKGPEHDCPTFMLREQQGVMGSYLHLLEVRAEIEGIQL